MTLRYLHKFPWAGWAGQGIPLQPLWGRWGADSLWGWMGTSTGQALAVAEMMGYD